MKTLDLRIEFKRRKTTRESMLQAFKRKGELSTREMIAFGPGMSSRLFELRKGHIIVAQYESPGRYRYIYLGEKNDDGTNVNVID